MTGHEEVMRPARACAANDDTEVLALDAEPVTAPPHVVILTGGGVPDEETPGPHRNDTALALHHAGIPDDERQAIMAGADAGTLTPRNALLLRVAAEAFKVGYRQAAMLHRVVAVYVLPGQPSADRFAAMLTAQVDPAYVRTAGDPLAEALNTYDQLTRKDPT